MINSHTESLESHVIGFIPAAPTHALVKICQFFWPAYSRLSEFKLSVRLDSSIKSVFEKIGHERVILCPNHSAHDDPIVAFAISSQLNDEFYFLTAREIFMWHPSLRSLWLQHLGCYSVLRSSVDVEAYRATCDLLLDKPHRVAIFPEGEVTHQNRFVLSLESGVERMALSVANILSTVGKREPVYLLPVGITYRYRMDISSQLLSILSKQEAKLAVAPRGTIQERVAAAFDRMLCVLEREHKCVSSAGSLGARISAFVDRTIEEIAATCGAEVPAFLNQRERLHLLKKVFINHRYARKDAIVTDNERLLYKQLRRAINLIGITDHSFEQLDTQERIAELICIIECEVSGRVTLRAPKEALVACSKPIDAETFVEAAKADRSAALKAMGKLLYDGINDALLHMSAAYPEQAWTQRCAATANDQ
jgi:1-acyl-sn-glycerol-3-phosphate acyltransferase